MPCVICGQWTPCPIWETISGNGWPYTRITEADKDSWVMGMYVDHQLIMWNIVCPVCRQQFSGQYINTLQCQIPSREPSGLLAPSPASPNDETDWECID